MGHELESLRQAMMRQTNGNYEGNTMKTLIVDDDFVCRLLLQELLKKYGPCHIAVNGKETVEAVRRGHWMQASPTT